MKFFYKVGFLVIGMMISVSSFSQDIHFSQFYMSPLNLNPAMTGVMNCNTRLVANYRNQWASVLKGDAYNTYSFSLDRKVPVGRTDYFGIGGSVWGDVAGALRFGTVQGRLSFAYSKKLGGYRRSSQFLSIGADVGVGQRKVTPGNAQWNSQFNGTTFDPLSQGGTISDPDFLFGDISAGIMFFANIDESNNYYIGLAAHHVNGPNISFQEGLSEPLSTRLTVHGGGQFELDRGLHLIPNVVAFFQGPHREFNLGTALRFALGNTRVITESWQFGVWYRLGVKDDGLGEVGGIHSDALIFAARFDFETYGLGFSYDYNVSALQNGGSFNGSFEFSLVYYICGPETRSVYCPRF